MEVPSIVVRRVSSADVAAFRQLRLRALREDPQAFASTEEREAAEPPSVWRQRVDRAASGDDAFIALAEADGAPVGMAGGRIRDAGSREAGLWGMWVDPAWRSRGVGRLLVRAVEDWAVRAGAETLTLWVVRSNASALALYRASGFVPAGATQPLPSDPSLLEVQLSKRL